MQCILSFKIANNNNKGLKFKKREKQKKQGGKR